MPTIQTRNNTGIYYKDGGTLTGDRLGRYVLSLLVLHAAVLLVAAIANAQELAASTSHATGPASGWWSPVRAESATAPQLQISMAELTTFKASDRVTESMDRQTDSLPDIDARDARPSLLADPSLPPGFLLSLLQANYAIWGSSLADPRSLVHVNGGSVCPLLQINYAGWHLPVTLYVSPLRGNDAR
jgi:hypothetical protein